MSGGRPNVLVIQADQFRWDCLGAAGHPDVRTPHLDRIAADGVLYTDAFCPLPVCTPSRYSLLSGLAVHQHGGWSNRSTLAAGVDTFPKALRRAGYRTAAAGKMHFTPTYLDVGYDRMVLAEQHGPGRYDDDYHRGLRAAGLAPVADLLDQEIAWRPSAPEPYWATFGTGRSDLPEEWHSTTWIGEQAVRELDCWDDDGGQLLHVSFVKPHHPFDPPAPWDELYDPELLSMPPGWTDRIPAADHAYEHEYFSYGELTEPVLRRVMAHYYATITQLDHQVGRLVEHLQRHGRYENTMIVFTSDHGEYLGFHHLLLKNGPMYDPLARVPFVVKYPAGLRARRGEHDDRLVSLIDLAPTALSVCGVEPMPDRSGLDLTDDASRRRYVFAENRHRAPEFMVRTREHKLLTPGDGERHALFDLPTDPYELCDRSDEPEYADVLDELRSALTRWVLLDTPVPNYVDEHAAQLDAPNVPSPDSDRRARHQEYFEAAVRSRSAAWPP